MSGILPASPIINMTRTTVHRQFSGERKALGMNIFGIIVPFVFKVEQPDGTFKDAIVIDGPKYHNRSPYVDLGVRNICCTKVLTFNIDHYVKCYLPTAVGSDGVIRTPYTFNHCRKCNVTLVDSCGHLIQMTTKRSYNVDKYIWRASEVLQNPSGQPDIFSYRKGVC